MIRNRWMFVPVAFLLLCVVTQLTTLYLSLSGDAAAVEPDYYSKAVNWDDERRQRAANELLDWDIDLTLEPVDLRRGTFRVAIEAHDPSGAPIEDAVVLVTAAHVTHADSPITARPVSTGTGQWNTQLQLQHTGRWEFDVEIVRGDDRFTTLVSRQIVLQQRTP